MKQVFEHIPGYTYGEPGLAQASVSMRELRELRRSAEFTEEDERFLRLAGEVLADQTAQIVNHWGSRIIAGIPNLARHSRTPEGNALPEYLAASSLRFQQWILDTCLRPEDTSGCGISHRHKITTNFGTFWLIMNADSPLQ